MPTTASRDVRNVIHNKELMSTIKKEFEQVIIEAPQRRQSIEAEWREFRNIFTLRHDEGKEIFRSRYSKFSKMPTPKRAISRLVEVIEKNLFPYTRAVEGMPISVRAEGESDDQYKERLNALKASVKRHSSLLEYQLFEQNQIRRRARPIILQYLLYDLGVAKVGAKLEAQHVFSDNQVGLKKLVMPTLSPVDIFRWYIYPDAVSEKSQAKWIYEWSVQRTSYLRLQEKLGLYHNVDRALSSESYRDMFETTTDQGSFHTHLGADAGARANRRWYTRYQSKVALDNTFFRKDGGYVFVFDAYYKEDIEYTDGTGIHHPRDGIMETVNFVYVNGEIVSARLVENDPYLDCRSNGLPNEFYQQPRMRNIHRLLYMEESLFSQMMEHSSRLGGVVHNIDPSTGINSIEDFKPERVINIPPGSYAQHQIQDSTRGFLTVLNQLESLIREELADTPATEAKMGVLGRGARTKGGMEMMAERAAFTSLRETMTLEDRIFKPALDKFYKMNRDIESNVFIQVNHGDDSSMGSIGYGYENVVVTPRDIQTAANFRWLGSMRIMSEARIADGLKELMMVSSKYPEELVKVDHVALLRMWVEQGLGIRNADAIIQEPDQETSIPLPIIATFLGQMTGNPDQAKQILQQLLIFSQQAKGGAMGGQPEGQSPNVKSMNTELLAG